MPVIRNDFRAAKYQGVNLSGAGASVRDNSTLAIGTTKTDKAVVPLSNCRFCFRNYHNQNNSTKLPNNLGTKPFRTESNNKYYKSSTPINAGSYRD